MMKRNIAVLFAGVMLLAFSGQTLAHHSFAATYDSSKRIELEGVIKQLIWRNPHSFLQLDVDDKDGKPVTWALEWGSVSQLEGQSGITRTTLRPGDKVKVAGAPARDPNSLRMLLQHLQRPADGFTWQGKVN